MANKLVKYQLIKFGNGYMTPSDIVNGGKIWENGNIKKMVLVGEIDESLVQDPNNYPDGVIEVITEEQYNNHFKDLNDTSLKNFKKKKYERETDPLFIEAIREKMLGRNEKWNEYLMKCKQIYNLTKIPSEEDM